MNAAQNEFHISFEQTGDPFVDAGGMALKSCMALFPNLAIDQLIEKIATIYVENWKANLFAVFHGSKITHKSYVGKIVNVTGQVRGVFRNGGHVFFTLQDETGSVKVVLWEDTLDALKIKGVDIESIKDGAHINIVGSVQIYRGELEVIPVHGNVKIS